MTQKLEQKKRKKTEKVKIDFIFCEKCPAPWGTTPDANCLCCDYIIAINTEKLEVSCNYQVKELYFPGENL